MNNKFCVYEECVKVPFWVWTQGGTSQTLNHLVSSIDLAPTISDWVGVVPGHSVNGISFKNLLTNPQAPWRNEILLEQLGESSDSVNFQAVRSSQYLYVEYKNGDREFYDLVSDPYQLENKINDPTYTSTITPMQSSLNSLKNQ